MMNSLFEQALQREQETIRISISLREIPKPFDFSNLLHLTKENAKAWKEINSPDISIPWLTPEGTLQGNITILSLLKLTKIKMSNFYPPAYTGRLITL